MNLDELVIKQLGYDSYEKGKNYKKSYLRYMNSHDFYDGSKIKIQLYIAFIDISIILIKNDIWFKYHFLIYLLNFLLLNQ